jgi:hypothetical protein
MKTYRFMFMSLAFFLAQNSVVSHALTCPDPQTTSLQWGVIPPPWLPNPFSNNSPQGELNTDFVRASILIAGYGQGVLCTYRNSIGDYSIWWPVITKIPAPADYVWIDTLGGFACSQGLSQCQFEVLDPV